MRRVCNSCLATLAPSVTLSAAGLIGHLTEEAERPIGFILSGAAAKAIEYDGE